MDKVKVFISHRQADSSKAAEWARRLKLLGITAYVDVLDPRTQDLQGRAISDYLHAQLQRCTHLLVIFTEATQGSMWVPFEIGIATERDIGIAIDLQTPPSRLPEYLLNWPVLRDDNQRTVYLGLVSRAEREIRLNESRGDRYSENFHAQLKRAIGQ